MSLLMSVRSIEKKYSLQPLLEDVSFELRKGDRAGLVGPNGCGKTTLLRVLKNELPPDSGSIEFARDITVGYLEQSPQFPRGKTIREIALAAMAHLQRLVVESEQLAVELSLAKEESEVKRLADRYELLQAELVQKDAFNLGHKIERVMQGLGFTADQLDEPADRLSGGEANRLLLGALLLGEPDIMLLDEPSNHLDIAATEWLEGFLKQTSSAFVVVSHDRYFLDAVTTRTLELVNGSIDSYPGNFSKYRILKAERLKVQERTWEKQQEEIAKIEDFIRRNHYGQKAAQAEDRRKKLERIERVPPPKSIDVPPMKFANASRTGDIVLRVENAEKSFGTRRLFSRLGFQIEREQRWGIVGANGTGKSTLLKCLLGQDQFDVGDIQFGTGVQIGYFDQKQEELDSEVAAVDAIRPAHRQMIDVERRDLLARFGIAGETALRATSRLSGGQRNRVALAKLAALDANFLILDEPTNHLDLWSRDALEIALRQFDGTVLVVSHDRYFLNQVCTHLLVFETGKVAVFPGTWEQYRYQTSQRELEKNTVNPASPSKSKSPDSRREDRVTQRPRRRFPFRKVADIEKEIEEREGRVQSIHDELIRPEVLRQGELVVDLQKQLVEQKRALDHLYDHWQEAVELNG